MMDMNVKMNLVYFNVVNIYVAVISIAVVASIRISIEYVIIYY